MEVFVRVAECGSFSRAAQNLDIANATATTYVRNLERHLNVTLINRNTHHLRLTEEGQLFLPRARELLHQLDRNEEFVRAVSGELKGPLRVEAPLSLGNSLICPAMLDFARRHPAIATYLTLTSQPHHVIERGIDVAVRIGYVEDADLVARPVYKASYVLCCTEQVARTLPTHPADLDMATCIGILREDHHFSDTWMLKKGHEHLELRPKGSLHFNSSDAALQAAVGGIGVTYVLDIFARRQLLEGSLIRVYPDWHTPTRIFYAVTPKSRVGSAKVRVFTDFMAHIFKSHKRRRLDDPVEVKTFKRRMR